MSVIDLRLKPAMLAHYDLPDITYPISLAAFDMALSGDGKLPFLWMLNQLQMRSKDGAADWQSLEPAMDRLAELLAPNDPRPVLSASGEEWWVEVGPVKLDGPIVTIQRGDKLVAALSATDGGRLSVSSA